MTNDWFQKEKNTFFKKERNDLLKPKKDKDDFKPERALKMAGNLLLVGGGILVGTKLLKAIS